MKCTEWHLILVALWLSANFVMLINMSHEPASSRLKTPDSSIIKKFDLVTHTISTPEYKTSIPFTARLLRPAVIAENSDHPLVVFLYGAGERGDDTVRQLSPLPQQMFQPD